MLKRICICYCIAAYIVYSASVDNSKNYGEFDLKLVRYEVCKGPKKMSCTNLTLVERNDTNVVLKLDVIKNAAPNRGKIVVIINGKPLVRLQMKRPCDHLFFKPLFQAALNVTEDCVFRKGHQELNLDIEAIAKKYYGGMFLYGNITFKSEFYNDECNISCTVGEFLFSPKNSSKTY